MIRTRPRATSVNRCAHGHLAAGRRRWDDLGCARGAQKNRSVSGPRLPMTDRFLGNGSAAWQRPELTSPWKLPRGLWSSDPIISEFTLP
jgi:hypothetical protein